MVSKPMQGSLMLDIAGTWLTPEDRQILRQPQVAGLILFARNIEDPRQVRELAASIRGRRVARRALWLGYGHRSVSRRAGPEFCPGA